MANWDFVFAYDTRFEEWLTEQGYPHPPVRPGNHLSTTTDMKWALGEQTNLLVNYPAWRDRLYIYGLGMDGFVLCIDGFDWDDDTAVPDECFRIRYMSDLQCVLLVTLCQRCGQLYIYRDTGEPAVIFEPESDPSEIYEAYCAAEDAEDAWTQFFGKMYT